MSLSIATDLFPIVAGTLAAVSCAILGNFLVLRRLSLMGDAISHSVLPGLVIAFLLTATRDPFVMLIGAGASGIATVVLVEVIKKLGRVEPGAAMGVVFSVLFALGVLLIRQVESLGSIDLDADCVLHGQLETLAWYGAPDDLAGLLSASTLREVPVQIWTLAGSTAVAVGFSTLFFKELRIAAFDPALATTQGFHAGLMHYLLMALVAATTVASFEAVGSVLVIAMLICPAATARLLTDRLRTQMVWSVVIAVATAFIGYVGAIAIPAIWGKDDVNKAGGMAMAAGGLLAVAIILSPRHGVLAKGVRRMRMAREIALDDVLGALFRARERGVEAVRASDLAGLLPGRQVRAAVLVGRRAGLLAVSDRVSLTPSGLARASELVRRHRLWESYLVSEAGVSPDHVHDTAERLEHLRLRGSLPAEQVDPHGKPIPSRHD